MEQRREPPIVLSFPALPGSDKSKSGRDEEVTLPQHTEYWRGFDWLVVLYFREFLYWARKEVGRKAELTYGKNVTASSVFRFCRAIVSPVSSPPRFPFSWKDRGADMRDGR